MRRHLIPLGIVCVLVLALYLVAGDEVPLPLFPRRHFLPELPSPAPRARGEDAPTPGGVWIEALPCAPGNLDPARLSNPCERRVAALIYSGLLRQDSAGRIVGDLARSWEVSPDGRQYTFHLRRDAHFSNGRPLTADDVAFSFRRLLRPEIASPNSWVLRDVLGANDYTAGHSNDVAGIRTEDDYTVIITLKRPRAAFPAVLTGPATYILDRRTTTDYESPTPAAAEGGRPGFFPVGTGPFRLASSPGADRLDLARRDDYHGTPPNLDSVKFLTGTSEAEAWELLGGGQVTAVRLAESRAAPDGTVLVTRPGAAVTHLAFDPRARVTADPRVRQAVRLAVDVPSVLEVALAEDHLPATGLIPPIVSGVSPRPGPDPDHDPARAGDLLREAGHPDGVKLSLRRPEGTDARRVSEAIVDQLQDLPVEVQIAPADEDGADTHPLHCDERLGPYPDPEGFLLPLLHSEVGRSAVPDGLHCPRMDTLLDSAAVLNDEAERLVRLREIERLAGEEVPTVPLYVPRVRIAVQPFVRDVRPAVLPEGQKMETVWFVRGR